MYDVIHRSFEEGQSDKSMMKLVKSRGGLLAHLGTTDCREVEHRIQNGDAHAKLIYDAMALNVANRRHHLLRFYRRGDPSPRVLHCSRYRLSRRG